MKLNGKRLLPLLWLAAAATMTATANPFDFLGGRAPEPPEKSAAPEAGAEVTFFQPDWLKEVLPDSEPSPGGECRLQAFAAQGEYEPVCFAVRSDRPTALTFELTPFRSRDGGSEIAPENLQLRAQRVLYTGKAPGDGDFKAVPAALEQVGTFALPAGETVLLALDIFVPPGTAEGVYRGEITASTPDGQSRTLPVTLRVLPFTLVRDCRNAGSFFNGGYLSNPARGRYLYASEAMLARLFAAHHAYNLNSIQLYEVTPKLRYADGRVTADFSELETLVRSWRAAGNEGMIGIDLRFVAWWCDELSVVLEQRCGAEPHRYTVAELEALYPHLNAVEGNLKARWSRDYRMSAQGADFFRQVCRQLLDCIGRNGWHDIVLLPEEEMGNGGLKLWGYEQFAPILREFPEAKVMLVDNSPNLGIDLGHRHPEWADIREYNRITPEIIANARADRRELWVYNQGWTRAAFGFPVWKLGAGGVHMWADQWADAPPYREGADAYNCWLLFYPSPEGPLPTMAALRTREGLDDLAYLDTLLAAIDRARAAGLTEAAAAAGRTVDALAATWPTTTDECRDWSAKMTPQSAFVERWKLASEILKLEKELEHAP